MADQEKTDEVLSIVRCARCGQRLEGKVECPFCSLFPEPPRKDVLPKWVFITACFFTSPLSIYFALKSSRLNLFEKMLTISGSILWFGVYFLRVNP